MNRLNFFKVIHRNLKQVMIFFIGLPTGLKNEFPFHDCNSMPDLGVVDGDVAARQRYCHSKASTFNAAATLANTRVKKRHCGKKIRKLLKQSGAEKLQRKAIPRAMRPGSPLLLFFF